MKNRLTLRLASAAVALTSAAVSGIVAVTMATATTTLTSRGDVNFRAAPTTSSSILYTFSAGQKATVVGSLQTSGWTQVSYNGMTGYVWTPYFNVASDDSSSSSSSTGSATVNGAVNVRTGPSTGYSIIGVASTGSTVSVTGQTSGTWVQVVWQGRTAWIYGSYLDITSAAPATSSGGSSSSSSVTTTGQIRTDTSVNVRATGYISGTLLGQLPAGTLANTTGNKTASYTEIAYQGRTGWVYTAYVTVVTQGPTNATTLSSTDYSNLDPRIKTVVDYAYAQLGKAYVWGAAGPNAFDCSGLVLMAYKQVGMTLPHYSGDQAKLGYAVSEKNMQPGDILYFGNPVNHARIYVGNGEFIHARNPTVGVVKYTLDSYDPNRTYFRGARRLIG